MSYKLVFDTETSGLPKNRKEGYNYKDLEQFDSARLLSISWLILNEENEIVQKKTYYIKPDNFEISQESIYIHGLSKDFLNLNGLTIQEVFLVIHGILLKYNIVRLIAHNIDFDINILRSELYRYEFGITLKKLNNIQLYCTMYGSQSKMNVRKWPKLSEAYKFFYSKEITNAHNAEYDTLHCYKIYLKLCE